MSTDTSLTIRDVRVRAVCVPMPEPHRTAAGVVTESPLVLTDVTASDGTVGRSITFTYTRAAVEPTASLIRNIAPLMVGQPLAPAETEQQLARRFRMLGTQGLVGMALAGIDMALWDALARSRGLPLVRLLGGIAKPIPVYGPVGFDGADESARVAEEWVSRGIKGVKAKIGYPTVEGDVAVIRAIRKAVGPEIRIMVDYNQSLTPTDAIERVRVLDGEGLHWIEEPTLAHDYAGHARVAREARTPIQCGENWWGITDVTHAITAGASDYLMPDVMKAGGVTGWMRAAVVAHAAGLRVSSHLWPELSAHLLACTPTAHWLEYADWWNPILTEPLQLQSGFAVANTTPGSGMDWNEEAVGRFLV